MFARVTAVFNIKENSLTVPEEAIVPQGGRQFVIKVVTQTQEQFDALAQAVKAAAAASAAASTAAGGTASSASSPVTGPAAGPAAGAPAGPAVAAPVFVDGKRLVSQRTEVKIGIRRPGRVEITDGVAEGDTLVVAGQQRLLRDNTAVRIVDLGRPTGSAAAPAASAAR
jgi:membrane fusion protein (multidrug efflux system)